MIDNKTIRKVIMLNKMLPSGSPTYENREASGAVANFTTNTVQPFVKCECTIDATESGTDELTLTKTGKNLFNKKPFSDWATKSPYMVLDDNLPKNALLTMVFIDKDTSVDISGCYLGFVKDTYNGGTVQNTDYHWALQNGTVRGRTDNVAEIGTDLCNYLMMYPTNEATYNKIFSRFDIMIVVGAETATTFEPYNAETYTVALEETAYGGKVDVIAGSGQIIDEHGDLVYTLFEPVSISAIEGVNNVWCDTGDIEVTYKYKTGEGGSSTKKYLPIFYDLYGKGCRHL